MNVRFSLAGAGADGASLHREYGTVADGPRFRFAHRLADAWIGAWPFRGGAYLAKQAASRLLPPLRGPTVCRTSLGFDLVVSPRDGGNYFLLGAYERGTLHVMRQCLRPGDAFVDVGASVGQMALYASRLVGDAGRVLAVEPQPERFRSLRDAIVLNQARNVVAHQVGLSDAEAEGLKLYCDQVSPSLLAHGTDSSDFELVDTVRLDELVAAEGITGIRMLKVDVEGFEAQVLRGAGDLLTGPDAPIVCLEHGGLGDDTMAPLRHLQACNDYRFYNLRGGKDRAGRLVRVADPAALRLGDNAFCFLESHVAGLAGSGLFA